MVIDGDVISLNKEEAEAIINKECQERLGINLVEFKEKRKIGELPRSLAVYDIEALLRFAKGKRQH
jgi:hypothetical protein